MNLIITILTLIIGTQLFAQASMPSLPETESANVQSDKVIAFNELKAKALTGDLESVHNLAQKYSSGVKGICPQDKKLAFDLYLYAASSGHKESQVHLLYYYKEAARKDEKHSADLLAEACMWATISGSTISGISDATRAEGIKRAGEFVANKNNNISEGVAKLNIPEKENLPQAATPKGYTKLKRFATFEDYDNYRIAVCKDYLAAFNVIKNKLANATPAEIKTYKDSAEKLIELQKCSKAYLSYNQPQTSTTEKDLKSSETFRKEQFQKIYSQISLIEINTDIQTPITLDQIKAGADFVDKLKDLIALKPKFYVRSVTY
jgi:TPR repeat protein